MTGERRDESVSVSLRELEKLENERQDRERRQREAHAVALQRANEESARRAQAEREARERADAEERERVRLREVEEEARREAMSRAAVEQARIAVEARTRAEEAERERRHEIELARVRAETKKHGGGGVVVGSGLVGAALGVAVCLGVYFGAVRPASAGAVALLESRIADTDAKTRELRNDALELHDRTRELQQKLDAANVEIARLETQLATKREPGNARGAVPTRPPATTRERAGARDGTGSGFGHACAGPGDPSCNF